VHARLMCHGNLRLLRGSRHPTLRARRSESKSWLAVRSVSARSARGVPACCQASPLADLGGSADDTSPLNDLALDEGEEVGIDDIGMNREHAVRVPWIHLQSRSLDKLRLKQDRVLVGHDLIVIALHHQGRYVDGL
jgi:hypothetical protein